MEAFLGQLYKIRVKSQESGPENWDHTWHAQK